MLRNACFGNTQKELYNPTEQRFQHYTPRRPGTPPPPPPPPPPIGLLPLPSLGGRLVISCLFIWSAIWIATHKDVGVAPFVLH